MSITTVRDRLAVILGDSTIVPGIKGATAGVPRNLAAADMPHVVITAGPATYETLGSALFKDTRDYSIHCLLKSWATGIDLEAEDLAATFIPLIREALALRPSLTTTTSTDPLPGVETSDPTGDTGVINLILADVAYAGCTMTLRVVEYIKYIPFL